MPCAWRVSRRARSAAVARDLGMHPETLRLWVRQDEAERRHAAPIAWRAPSARSSTALRREVRDLRRANEILKAASVFFARELDQPRPR